MSDYPDWVGLREIDRRAGTGKGTAFRAFKALAPNLIEGTDYRVLDPHRDREVIDTLRHAGRIYASSVRVVLLAPAAALRLTEVLGSASGGER
jgi:hypothetical protein